MDSLDCRLIEEIVTNSKELDDFLKQELKKTIENSLVEHSLRVQYPLDKDIRDELKDIKRACNNGSDYDIYRKAEEIINLWKLLIKKSIICLRYFDTREPFQEKNQKQPHAYGVEELAAYYKDYNEFEQVLYGGVKYYRDHVIHVFRVWLLGISRLLKDKCNYLNHVIVEEPYKVTGYEKISMWTIISLCHDLGYPLEKSLQVVDKTKNMMKSFVHNPLVNMDISFSGVQDSMNDYVLRFVSSKMWEYNEENHYTVESTKDKLDEEKRKIEKLNSGEYKKHLEKKRYVARLQPKYYFKFQKSLEHYDHGILSTLIVYKTLLYFLESDYSINEDYRFDGEDSRQFYIRREILRSMASHTCSDIYQNDMFRFSFLLILCDDAQEWGRKKITELYVPSSDQYQFGSIEFEINESDKHKCEFSDEHIVNKDEDVQSIIDSFKRQSVTYRNIFRDGLDTVKRNFTFIRKMTIDYQPVSDSNKIKYVIKLTVSAEDQTKVTWTKNDDYKYDENDSLTKSIKEAFRDYCVAEGNKQENEIILD